MFVGLNFGVFGALVVSADHNIVGTSSVGHGRLVQVGVGDVVVILVRILLLLQLEN